RHEVAEPVPQRQLRISRLDRARVPPERALSDDHDRRDVRQQRAVRGVQPRAGWKHRSADHRCRDLLPFDLWHQSAHLRDRTGLRAAAAAAHVRCQVAVLELSARWRPSRRHESPSVAPPAWWASSLWGTRIERIERILRIARLRGREHRAPHRRCMNDNNVFVVNKKSKGLANERLDAPLAAERSVKSVQSVQSVFPEARNPTTRAFDYLQTGALQRIIA